MRLQLLKTIVVVSALLAVGAAQESKDKAPPPTPAVWSTTLPGFLISGDEKPVTHSVFTPDVTIIVTRVEVYDSQGPLHPYAPPKGDVPCSPQIAIELSAAGVDYQLPISSSFVPGTNATYTDSGPLRLRIEGGKRLMLSRTGPRVRYPINCQGKEMNVVVQYRAEAVPPDTADKPHS